MNFLRFNKRSSAGFTIIEMLFVISIGGILIITLTAFVGRSFQISRYQFEQVRGVEDARIVIERMSDTLRNARNLDCDNNGVTDDDDDLHWLLIAKPKEIVVITNADNDADPELVRYALTTEDSNILLDRTVYELSPDTPCQTVGNLENSGFGPRQFDVIIILISQKRNEPIFSYYESGTSTVPIFLEDEEGAELSLDDRLKVGRLGISLNIDATEQQPEGIAVETQVSIRGQGCTGDDCAIVPRCSSRIIPEAYYDSDDDNFVETALTDCRNVCATQTFLECPWSIALGDGTGGDPNNIDNDILSQCRCQDWFVPPATNDIVNQTLVPLNNANNEYTNFVKQCWGIESPSLCDGSQSSIVGQPIFSATCLAGNESCTCWCYQPPG